MIKIDDIIIERTERFELKGLNELAKSIQEYGLLNPVILQKMSDGKVKLVAGRRRLEALKILGIKSLPSEHYKIITTAKATESEDICLIENTMRDNLNLLEIGLYLTGRGMISSYATSSLKEQQITAACATTGLSRSKIEKAIANAIIYNNAPSYIKSLHREGKLTFEQLELLSPPITPISKFNQVISGWRTHADAFNKTIAYLQTFEEAKDKAQEALKLDTDAVNIVKKKKPKFPKQPIDELIELVNRIIVCNLCDMYDAESVGREGVTQRLMKLRVLHPEELSLMAYKHFNTSRGVWRLNATESEENKIDELLAKLNLTMSHLAGIYSIPMKHFIKFSFTRVQDAS